MLKVVGIGSRRGAWRGRSVEIEAEIANGMSLNRIALGFPLGEIGVIPWPSGTLVTRIDLSTPAPSMPCFAGATLSVTTLRRGRGDELVRLNPSMGGLFQMLAPATGVDIGRLAV